MIMKKTYTLKQAMEQNLLPWSIKTILRMHKNGKINLINVAHGKKNRWAVTGEEITRIMDKYKRERTNKMIDGRAIDQS